MQINNCWKGLIKEIIRTGDTVSPREMGCYEIMALQSRIDMTEPVVTVRERKMGYRFMCAEAYWILTGDNRVETITPYSRLVSRFSDDGYRFQGAYGPKITEQIKYVVDALYEDNDSRQAVINIWREMPRNSRDIPCTLSLQFLIRKKMDGYKYLNCLATMRSSDLWLGWVYDVFNFSMVSAYICLMLRKWMPDLQLGYLILTAGSQHIYDREMDRAKRCMDSKNDWTYNSLKLSDFVRPDDLLSHLVALRDHKWGDIKSSFMIELKEHV